MDRSHSRGRGHGRFWYAPNRVDRASVRVGAESRSRIGHDRRHPGELEDRRARVLLPGRLSRPRRPDARTSTGAWWMRARQSPSCPGHTRGITIQTNVENGCYMYASAVSAHGSASGLRTRVCTHAPAIARPQAFSSSSAPIRMSPSRCFSGSWGASPGRCGRRSCPRSSPWPSWALS